MREEIESAWGQIQHEGFSLRLNDSTAWVTKYYGTYDKGYENRKAVGLTVGAVPAYGVMDGLRHVLENWDSLAESYLQGGELPSPRINICLTR